MTHYIPMYFKLAPCTPQTDSMPVIFLLLTHNWYFELYSSKPPLPRKTQSHLHSQIPMTRYVGPTYMYCRPAATLWPLQVKVTVQYILRYSAGLHCVVAHWRRQPTEYLWSFCTMYWDSSLQKPELLQYIYLAGHKNLAVHVLYITLYLSVFHCIYLFICFLRWIFTWMRLHT